MSTLDNLRKEAKRWLKALREQDPAARARLERAYPAAPKQPGLRDVQHAMAHELGEASWDALKQSVARRRTATAAATESTSSGSLDARVHGFMEFACWDHHTHGLRTHRSRQRTAMRYLAATPAIARASRIHNSTGS